MLSLEVAKQTALTIICGGDEEEAPAPKKRAPYKKEGMGLKRQALLPTSRQIQKLRGSHLPLQKQKLS